MPTIDPITTSPARLKARARVARLAQEAKRHPDVASEEAVENARRDYRAATLEDHICKVVDASPPLTPEQRDELAMLLQGGGSGGTAA